MKTKDAISRLSFTISKGNKPNYADKAALNAIIQFINNSDKETVQQHSCFAKLYALVLTSFLMKHKDIDFANKLLNKELAQPLEYQTYFLETQLKAIETENFLRSNGIVDDMVVGKPIEESIARLEQNKKLFPQIDTRLLLETQEMWDSENVMAHLVRNINESLTKYKNV